MDEKKVFSHGLGEKVEIEVSGEAGQVVARSESLHSEPQYLVRYCGADGQARETWWSQSALRAAG